MTLQKPPPHTEDSRAESVRYSKIGDQTKEDSCIGQAGHSGWAVHESIPKDSTNHFFLS